MYANTYRYGRTIFLLGVVLFPALVYGQDEKDSLKTVQLRDVVVTASRMQENINQTPISVEKMSLTDIRRAPAPSFFDAIENIKGVQMITPSLGFRVINTRGFTNTTNVRFTQLVDGMDNQAPHIGAPMGNVLGPGDLDIAGVEIVPGVASALYGMNTINGLANFTTLDPVEHQGFSFQQKIGVNRLNSSFGAKPLSETSMRYAAKVSSKLAFKVNATFMRGTDWVANDQTDLNPNANISTGLTGADNPALDPVNSYGNESPNRKTLSLNGKNYVVARTGYNESDVVDYSLQTVKTDAAIHYTIKPDQRLIYTFRYSNVDNVYQRSNRFRLANYLLMQHGLSFQSKAVQLKAYVNIEDTGDSYNARSMAENIDRWYKSDNTWFANYTTGYKNAITGGASVADAHRAARVLADNGRPIPGTAQFQGLIDQLGTINNWDYGAALRVKSSMYHAEGQLNLTQSLLRNFGQKTSLELQVGVDHRSYVIVPDGNYFINPVESGENIVYGRTGAFVQAYRNFFNNKLRFGATLRADKNDYFDTKYNPRFTAVYNPVPHHNFRASFQTGYRFPSVFEGYSNVNSGGVKRVGGLPVMSNGIFENGYLRASIDAFQAAILVDVNKNGLTKNQAIEKNKGILKKNDYTYIQPEFIQSLEWGYRGLWFDEKLKVDMDFYYNQYSQFIAQVEMNIPKTANPDSIPYYLADKNKQDRYRMWTNSKTVAYNYGSSISAKYFLPANYYLGGNATYAQLERKSTNDGFEDGFNTPQWMTNFSVGNDKFFRSLGFQVTYRWQSSYYWQSFLVNGNVPAYQTVDAQLSLSLPPFLVKVGGTNIFNQYYNGYLGGPSVGGFYYTSLTLKWE